MHRFEGLCKNPQDLLQAFHDLEMALPDAQTDVETLEAEMEDNEDGRDA